MHVERITHYLTPFLSGVMQHGCIGFTIYIILEPIYKSKSVVLNNDASRASLDLVDDVVDNNTDAVENNPENENSEEKNIENNGATSDKNEWTTTLKMLDLQKVMKKLEFINPDYQ